MTCLRTPLLLVLPLLLLTGCGDDFELPSVVAERRAEVATGTFNQTYSAALVDNNFLKQISDSYNRYGAGPLYVTTTYDPKGGSDTGGEATRISARVHNYLKQHGVNEVQSDTLPTPNAGPDHQIIIRYGTITAQAPEGCGVMPGYTNRGATTRDTTYGYGCTVETLLAQQVARPADLAGRDPGNVTSDGARQTAVINDRGYYGNESFEPLVGDAPSGD